MSSVKLIRDPKTDHLLTPENFALLVINYPDILAFEYWELPEE